jgi:hypothetical protein
MYDINQRKSRNNTEDKQLLKGIAVFFVLAVCFIGLILSGFLS